MVFLYHYTDLAGVTGILRDHRINISTKATDAYFGEGVYLTGMPPQFGQQRIIFNNYDSSSRLQQNPHLFRRADYYFKLNSEDLATVSRLSIKRDVWLYPGHIAYSQAKWEFGSTSQSASQHQQLSSRMYGGQTVSLVPPQWHNVRTIIPGRGWQW